MGYTEEREKENSMKHGIRRYAIGEGREIVRKRKERKFMHRR